MPQANKLTKGETPKAKIKKRPPSAAAVARFERRKSVVAAVQQGETVVVVSRVFRVPQRTIFLWLAWYRSGGWDALRDDAKTGRPKKISAEIMSWLYQFITQGDPRQLKLEFCLWTLAIVRTAIKKHHDIEVSKSSVSRLLAQMGLTPQVPVYRSYRRSPSKVRYYLKNRFPRAAEMAKKLGGEIYFIDESRVRVDEHRGTTWAPIGKTPVVKDTGDRFGVNLISGVSARGLMHFQCFEGYMDSKRFIEFLCDLRNDVGHPIVCIVDGGSYHVSKEVGEFLSNRGQAAGIYLFRLPPYSPELNPDEQVWNHAKAKLGKMFLESKAALRSAIESVMCTIKESTALIKSFFQMKHTLYANISQ